MNIRFTDANWAKFAIGKETTIRTRRLKNGIYEAMGGSRFKPFKRGKVELTLEAAQSVWELTHEDARRDGFKNAIELLMELARLNPKLKWDDLVFIYKTKVI